MRNVKHTWVSIAEAMRALGVGRTRVMNLCSRHVLRSSEIAGRIVVSRDSLALLKQRMEDDGHTTDTNFFADEE